MPTSKSEIKRNFFIVARYLSTYMHALKTFFDLLQTFASPYEKNPDDIKLPIKNYFKYVHTYIDSTSFATRKIYLFVGECRNRAMANW